MLGQQRVWHARQQRRDSRFDTRDGYRVLSHRYRTDTYWTMRGSERASNHFLLYASLHTEPLNQVGLPAIERRSLRGTLERDSRNETLGHYDRASSCARWPQVVDSHHGALGTNNNRERRDYPERMGFPTNPWSLAVGDLETSRTIGHNRSESKSLTDAPLALLFVNPLVVQRHHHGCDDERRGIAVPSENRRPCTGH